MKQLFLALLITSGITGFSQETTIKEKVKTKVGHHRYERKIVKEETPAGIYGKNASSAHTAYRNAHKRPVHQYHASTRKVHHSSHAGYVRAHKKHHVVHHKKHYKEIKKKYHKGEYKVKYKS